MLGFTFMIYIKIKITAVLSFYQVYYFPKRHVKCHKLDDLKEQKFYSLLVWSLAVWNQGVKGNASAEVSGTVCSLSLPASASYWLFLAFLARHSPLCPWGHMAHVSLFVSVSLCSDFCLYIKIPAIGFRACLNH